MAAILNNGNGGVAFVVRDDFIPPASTLITTPAQAAQMFNFDYSPMDNYSEISQVTPITFTFPAGTTLRGLFLGNVNFTSARIALYSDVAGLVRIGNFINIIIERDNQDNLYKHWVIFDSQQQTTPIRRIIITPQMYVFNTTVTQIGALVFARIFHVLPRRPRQGLSNTAEPSYIQTGVRAFSVGSPRISSRMNFRLTTSQREAFDRFLFTSAGKLMVVIEDDLFEENEGRQYVYFARRQGRARVTRGEALEVGIEIVGVV